MISSLQAAAGGRALPTLADALGWHSRLYAGCRVPVPGYVGHLRGDPRVPELVDHEVGVGPPLADGLPERVGVWSTQVDAEIADLIPKIHAGLQYLDDLLPVGQRPRSVDHLHDVVALAAVVHGEWVRIHPFANGNGRTARTWAAAIALRYSLPVFITSKPRPDDVAYARAARESMGRPPNFRGNHDPAIAVFGHLLSLALLA
ncbi:Fic family protein [Geodermatophilus sp. YIM 151500]|uniref:Fic family protein n=1 Tax=Geodermatophilus sp. YIM 151500 TaxID=2984531 RepID=UPI0021E4D28D|nr:Fic family protein [Geodermatophilus sp. YIM 151500]MCV2488264.1 Fic family protein [Geodermatophilus sp. YIM 151500]